ncbi:MAG TPA: hypothetical protein VGQ81_02490, partial [Acidobacteriota bacterium]|nr:hypothetical protein [Acidobacteriota bacterium]
MSKNKVKNRRKRTHARAKRRRSSMTGRAAPAPARLDDSAELWLEPEADRDLDQHFARIDEWIAGESPTLEAHLLQRGFTL